VKALNDGVLELSEMVERTVPWYLKGVAKSFTGVPGSTIFNALSGGDKVYYGYVLKKKEAFN